MECRSKLSTLVRRRFMSQLSSSFLHWLGIHEYARLRAIDNRKQEARVVSKLSRAHTQRVCGVWRQFTQQQHRIHTLEHVVLSRRRSAILALYMSLLRQHIQCVVLRRATHARAHAVLVCSHTRRVLLAAICQWQQSRLAALAAGEIDTRLRKFVRVWMRVVVVRPHMRVWRDVVLRQLQHNLLAVQVLNGLHVRKEVLDCRSHRKKCFQVWKKCYRVEEFFEGLPSRLARKNVKVWRHLVSFVVIFPAYISVFMFPCLVVGTL